MPTHHRTRRVWLPLAAVAAAAALLLPTAPARAAGAARPWRGHVVGPAARSGLLLDEEFTGPAGSAGPLAWNRETGGGGWGNQELETYTAGTANAALDGAGHLVLTARRSGSGYTSARLDTLGSFAFTYGLAQARVEVPSGQGLWPAFWMMGTDIGSVGWPYCGEIDAMETVDADPTTVYGSVHEAQAQHTGAPYVEANGGGTQTTATPLSAGFHTYGVDREPGRITFLLDSVAYRTVTPADLPAGSSGAFTGPMFLLLDLAVGGRWPGSPDTTTPFPATMVVDWVRVTAR